MQVARSHRCEMVLNSWGGSPRRFLHSDCESTHCFFELDLSDEPKFKLQQCEAPQPFRILDTRLKNFVLLTNNVTIL